MLASIKGVETLDSCPRTWPLSSGSSVTPHSAAGSPAESALRAAVASLFSGSSEPIPSQSALRAASRSGASRTAFIHMSRPTLHEYVTLEADTVISSTGCWSPPVLARTTHSPGRPSRRSLPSRPTPATVATTGSPGRSGWWHHRSTTTWTSELTPSDARTSKPSSVASTSVASSGTPGRYSSMSFAAM
jgi:hypothetical protein